MRLSAALIIIGFLHAASATAAEVSYAGVEDAVTGQPGVTYLDLLRQVAPDLAPGADGIATGHLAKDLPYLSGGDPSAAAGDTVTIQDISVLPVRAGGRERLALLVDLGDGGERVESFTALALFDDAPEPKLLDVADVSLDRFTTFFSPPRLDLSPDDQAIVVRNGHDNSNQSYELTTMLFVRDDRLTELGEVLTFSDWSCVFEHFQKPMIEVVPDRGAPYAAIRASVLDEVTVRDEDCGDEEPPAPFRNTVSATWRWNAGEERFLPDSDALEKLAVSNQDRF